MGRKYDQKSTKIRTRKSVDPQIEEIRTRNKNPHLGADLRIHKKVSPDNLGLRLRTVDPQIMNQ